MSNSLDPDQARRFVGPYLGPNCLQRLSAGGTIFLVVDRVNVFEIAVAEDGKNKIDFVLSLIVQIIPSAY